MTSAPHSAERHSAPVRPVHAAVRRTAFINLLLACLLIVIADEPLVTMVVGGATILVAALTGLWTAFRLTRRAWQTTSPTTLAVWMLGLVALVIAGVGLHLANTDEPMWRATGVILFAAQIALILWLDTTPAAERRSA